MQARTNERRKAIGANLQEARKRAGYRSAWDFAEHIGVNKNTYTGYEQGMSGLSLERALEMADELEVSLDWLVGRKFAGRAPTAGYSDPRQKNVNDGFEVLSEKGREAVAYIVSSMAKGRPE